MLTSPEALNASASSDELMLNLDGTGSALYDVAFAGTEVVFLTPAFGAALTVLGAAASSSASRRAASTLRWRAASSLAAWRNGG